jgi:hypothetical protein
MGVQQPAVHRTILVVDVAGFGGRHRTNKDQRAIREGLYRALRIAFEEANVKWDDCTDEDRGDGVMILVPPEIPKAQFTDALPAALVRALKEHNQRQPREATRIRLRMVLHAGEIEIDSHGVTSNSLNHAFRLLEARPLKIALTRSASVLAVITSEWFFEEVTRHCSAADPAAFRQFQIEVKETVAPAWICLPDDPRGPEILTAISAAEREAQMPRDNSPGLEQAQAPIPGSVTERVAERIDKIAEQITALGTAQQELLHSKARVGDTITFRDYATKLRLRLTALRRAVTECDPHWTQRGLDEVEHTVARAARRVSQESQRLGRILAERQELRGMLSADRATAVDSGLAEDLELAELYERAHKQLFQQPFDPEAARATVRSYQQAIHYATGELKREPR